MGQERIEDNIPEWILKNLCLYDARHPDSLFDEDDRTQKEQCFCDNCFYGRTKLAEYIIEAEFYLHL